MGLCVNAQLKTKFYSSSCPKAEAIVRSTVQSHMNKDPTVAAGLLRLHFHDCFVQVWDFYLKPEDRFSGKIIYWFDVDLEECNMQSQVIHTALCREVHQANIKEIWFDFGNSRTRFGLGEFAIISGLLCKGDSSIEKYIGRGDTFVDKYFRDMTVNYAAVKQRFLNSIFKDDVFAFRMAVLYFVTSFLLSKPGRKKVDSELLHLIGSDIAGFEFSYGFESDDDFEDVRQPRVDVDKTAVLDELKDSVLGLVVRQVGLECALKEFRKEVDEKFTLLEENLKGYIDRNVGEDLTFYFDTKFLELKVLIKDSIANVVPQSNEDEDEDDGGGGGVGSTCNLDDISDDVEVWNRKFSYCDGDASSWDISRMEETLASSGG
ncbi:hypothetical protein G4B88_015893 [Cannabis sativa]|uniref:Peroxidase n=1 Tax=Cannabis sativa TaxID=3483 RepID=A0A7J6G6B7_CANSA|nr:hypothetical protein G4B88_015893 [Cannabis sativa]